MRTHRQLVVYNSILQTLHETGCPFCRFLKDFQASRLQNHSESELRTLCNFHAWGLAAVQDAPAAAKAFIKLVNAAPAASNGGSECDICKEVEAEEEMRIREFVSCIERTEVMYWLRSDAVLCLPHAIKLRKKVPPVVAPRIDGIMIRCRQQLTEQLQQLRDEPGPDRTGWGALGRAAEFLVAQRGLRA